MDWGVLLESGAGIFLVSAKDKKRTGFGPHSCDDLFHDYNDADDLINLCTLLSACFHCVS